MRAPTPVSYTHLDVYKRQDFDQAVGEQVEVRLYRPVEGVKSLTGALVGLVEGQVVIEDSQGRCV